MNKNRNNFKQNNSNASDALASSVSTKKNSNGGRSRNKANNKSKSYSKPNDSSWYTLNPRLVKDAASIPTAMSVGLPFAVKRNGTIGNQDPEIVTTGVHTIQWIPTLGNTTISTPQLDAINVSATGLFAYITHANSRNTSYDKSDLMMYILAVSSAYNYFAFLRRVYGKLTGFSAIDKNTPELLVSAMGVNYNDLVRRAKDLRTYINVMADKLSRIPLPSGMSMLERQIWMNESIFKDTTVGKPQYYMYVQAAYYRYDEFSGRGRCELVSPRDSATLIGEYSSTYGKYAPANNKKGLSIEELMDFGDSLMNPLIGSGDIDRMAADVIKAMGSNLFRVAGIDENYTIEPMYNPEVLSQFENSYSVHLGHIDTPVRVSGGISQNGDLFDSVIRNEVALAFSSNESDVLNDACLRGQMVDTILNFHTDTVTPEDVMVATRMTNKLLQQYVAPPDPAFTHPSVGTLAGFNSTFQYYMYAAHGTETILNSTIWFNIKTISGFMAYDYASAMYLKDDGSTEKIGKDDVIGVVARMNALSQFDWSPLTEAIYLFNSNAELAKDISVVATSWNQFELQNFTTIDVDTLKRMHDVAILSEVSFRGIGEFGLK